MRIRLAVCAISGLLVATAASHVAFAQSLSNYFHQPTGPTIQHVIVVPIFWGKEWDPQNNPKTTALQISNAANAIVAGPYMNGLLQYGINRGAVYRQANPIIVDTSEPPTELTFDALWNQLIEPIIGGSAVPSPADGSGDRYFYVAFVPHTATGPGGAPGAHASYGYHGAQAHIAYVRDQGLATITAVFSHELAEEVTDPETTGYRFDNEACADGPGVCEIGDVCAAYIKPLNKINVAAYWSQLDDACIIPTVPIAQQTRWWLLPGQKLSSDGGLQSGLSAALNGRGGLELFGVGLDGAIWHITQNANEAWAGWQSLGGNFHKGQFVSAHNADGRLEVFAIGTDGALWHDWELTAGGSWSGWYSMGGNFIGAPRVALNSDGGFEAFACGADDTIWHISQSGALDWGQDWHSLGGRVASGPFVAPLFDVASNADGRIEVFALGTDGAVWHAWQNVANADPSAWSNWYSIGGSASSIAAGRNQNGSLEVFTRAADNSLTHIAQTGVADWGKAWHSLGGILQGNTLIVGSNQDGRLEVFTELNGAAHIWQTTPNAAASAWSGWASFSASFQQLGLARNADGRFELFGLATDGSVYHCAQDAPSSGWDY